MFDLLVVQPLFNLLVLLYNVIPFHDLGLAIILLTVIVKVVLSPFSWQQLKAQKAMQEIQPKIEALKAQYKDDKAGLQAAQVKFFQEEKINPFATCWPLLVQLPFLIGIYTLFIKGFSTETLGATLYPFVHNPETLDVYFFGLSMVEHATQYAIGSTMFFALMIIPVLAGLAQFVQTKMMIVPRPPKVDGSKDEDMAAVMNTQMMYLMPLLTVFFGSHFPAGLSLYWLVNTLLSLAQQWYFLKDHHLKTKRGAGEVVDVQ